MLNYCVSDAVNRSCYSLYNWLDKFQHTSCRLLSAWGLEVSATYYNTYTVSYDASLLWFIYEGHSIRKNTNCSCFNIIYSTNLTYFLFFYMIGLPRGTSSTALLVFFYTAANVLSWSLNHLCTFVFTFLPCCVVTWLHAVTLWVSQVWWGKIWTIKHNTNHPASSVHIIKDAQAPFIT